MTLAYYFDWQKILKAIVYQNTKTTLPGWELDEWFHDEEHYRGKRGHIFYVHTKYMLIDPISDDPKFFPGQPIFPPIRS